MFDSLLSFLFPPRCPVCGAYVEQRGWCEPCLRQVLQVHRLPLSAEMHEVFTGGIWALGIYSGGLRNLLRQLKYASQEKGRNSQGKAKVKRTLQDLQVFMDRGVAEFCRVTKVPDEQEARADILALPVPLHEKKLKLRGFNQSEVLFREAFQQQHIAMGTCLKRIRNTTPQFGLNLQERQANVQDAFVVEEIGQVAGREILLLDDIMTTGATLLECGRAARKAGAVRLTGLVAASGRT